MQPTQKSNVGPIVIVIVIIIAIIAAIALSSNKNKMMNEDGSPMTNENTSSGMTNTTNGNTNRAGGNVNTTGVPVGGTPNTPVPASTRYVSPAGFTVYYPSDWGFSNAANSGIAFKENNINGVTIMTLQPSSGSSITSGNIKYEYDSFKKVWIKTVTAMEQGKEVATPGTATPLFFTVDGSPVFAGATPKTNIIAFSTNTFLTVTLEGSKWGPVVDPLTKTVAINGKKIDANTLVNLVSTMVTANKNK